MAAAALFLHAQAWLPSLPAPQVLLVPSAFTVATGEGLMAAMGWLGHWLNVANPRRVGGRSTAAPVTLLLKLVVLLLCSSQHAQPNAA